MASIDRPSFGVVVERLRARGTARLYTGRSPLSGLP